MKRKELRIHLRTPFHSNIAFTTRNVVTTAHDCIANIGIRHGTDISKKQIKLSNLKQLMKENLNLVVKFEMKI